MKILLLNPPLIAGDALGLSLSYGEPLGLAYIAAAVERCDRHEVEVLDAMGEALSFKRYGEHTVFGLTTDEIIQRLKATTFDALGITVTRMYNEIHQIPALIERIRREFPETTIIAGGPDVTLEWASYMELGTIDYCVMGEGENTIIQLLDYLDGLAPFSDVKGVCYRDEKGEVKAVAQLGEVDIETVPWPARHLFPMENYFRNKSIEHRSRVASILTSRACPYSCAFCSTIEVWGRKWRGRTAKDVVDEIEHLVKNFRVGQVIIYDDNFLVDRKRAEAIADGIIERKLKIGLAIAPGLMIHLLNFELLRKLRKAGLTTMQMQLESGNTRTLEYIDKHIDISKAKDMVAAAHRAGLTINTNVLLGFHFETREDIEESIRVAESIGYDNVNYVLAEPKPKTRLHHDFVKAGLLKYDDPVVMPVDTLHFKGSELAEILGNARRLHARNRKLRYLRLATWIDYLLPKYVYNPGTSISLAHRMMRRAYRKIRQRVLADRVAWS